MDLDIVYAYYKQTADRNVAKKLTDTIVSPLKVIRKLPGIGTEHDGVTRRKYVISYYKVYYDITDNQITVLRIFDTRQDPDTLLLPH